MQALADISTLIESFAARGLESVRSVMGISLSMLQDRRSSHSYLSEALLNDGSLAFNKDGLERELFISADMSRYNESETLFEQFSLAVSFARAFHKIGNAAKTKAWVWVAKSIWMGFISRVEGRDDHWYAGWRLLNRLLSGVFKPSGWNHFVQLKAPKKRSS